MNKLAEYAKAVTAALTSGIIYLMAVIAPAANLSDITFVQWLGFGLAIFSGFAATAAVPNALPKQATDPVHAAQAVAGSPSIGWIPEKAQSSGSVFPVAAKVPASEVPPASELVGKPADVVVAVSSPSAVYPANQ